MAYPFKLKQKQDKHTFKKYTHVFIARQFTIITQIFNK